MKKALIRITEPITYITRFVFVDGRSGSLRPESGQISLCIEHEINTPMKQVTTPFKSLVSLINNRFLLDKEDPILYSGLLEPKNGLSVQEYYIKNVVLTAEEMGFWFSEDNSVPIHTLGGISLAVSEGPSTVENLSFRIASYLKIAMSKSPLFKEYLDSYKSIEFSSSNKSASVNFSDI